jgi:signal transduction histidine kinase
VSLLLLGVSTYFRILDGQSLAFLLGYELVSAATMMAAAIALGDSTRARRALRAEQEQSARLIAQEHAYLAEQRVQAERVRMARDLHDTVGHSLAVIALHAAVAQEAIGPHDDAAQQALSHIRTATGETLRELRATVKVLRNPSEQPDHALTTLANLTTLVNQAQASGLQVTVTGVATVGPLPATVETAAYRIVQEALTNVIRHAAATQVAITIHADQQALQVTVHDNGCGAAPITPGSGITGMTERARLLGGALRAERQPDGFVIRAVLPLAEVQ